MPQIYSSRVSHCNVISNVLELLLAGSEVDIWSMGVLLYALLCGFLPFDDNNMENLYKKILASVLIFSAVLYIRYEDINLLSLQGGKYEEPHWLSSNSKALIRSMLQINPEKRITIHELCNHPWITASCLKPVAFVQKTKVSIFHCGIEFCTCTLDN